LIQVFIEFTNIYFRRIWRKERSALRDLQERDSSSLHFWPSFTTEEDIIIKPADKGSAVVVIVVMDKMTYLQEAERQLSDCRFYEKLDSDPTLDFTQKIKRVLEAMHVCGHLDNKTMEYLTPEDPKPGRFYLLLTIHKVNNPGRPSLTVVVVSRKDILVFDALCVNFIDGL
jgi:hypothetical protein